MGAGVQRWWRDQSRFEAAIASWRTSSEITLARAIAKTPTKRYAEMRVHVRAWSALWKFIGGR